MDIGFYKTILILLGWTLVSLQHKMKRKLLLLFTLIFVISILLIAMPANLVFGKQ